MENLKCTQEEYDLAMKLLDQIASSSVKTEFKLPKWEPPPPDPNACQHPGMPVLEFEPELARTMPSHEVKKRWPRGCYNCLICNQSVIHYASFEHYIAGDW